MALTTTISKSCPHDRRALNHAADSALATRHAEAWYVATVLATAAASWALLTIARALTAATKETP